MAEQLLLAGLNALKRYVALHVLTCLVPAFLLAEAIVSFVSRETIIGYLGSAASKIKSFAIAGGGSFFVSVCSCTVIPVASGIYHGGAGIGPAFILVWDIGTRKEDIYVLLVTTGIAIINIGIAFVAGLALYYALKRKVVKV